MNIQHVLFFCFLSALCGGNTGLASAKLNIYTGAEGGSGTINCHLSLSGSRKFFCKDECKAADILIKTDDDSAQSGRYSIKYRKGSSGRGIVSVTITNLTKSDSGRYRCGLGGTLVPDSYTDFGVRVSDAALLDGNSGFISTDTEGENITLGCRDAVTRSRMFLCKGECKNQEDILIETDGNSAQSGRYSIEYKEGSIFGLSATITQVTKSDTGRYKCGYGRALSPDSFHTLSILVIDASDPSASTQATTQSFTPSVFPQTTIQFSARSDVPCPGYFWPLVVCVPLVFVLLAGFLLVLYKWKNTRGNTDGIHMETCVTNKNLAPVSKCDDAIYENLDPATTDQEHSYS